MSEQDTARGSGDKSPQLEKWGCAILILATLLFAFQRYLVFGFLHYQAGQGSQTSQQMLTFLFGEPPFSIFDVLLGLEVPDGGLVLILQPRSWVIIILQGIHFGLNFGLVYIPFWGFSRFRYWSRAQKGLACGGCVGAVLILIALAASILLCSPSSRPDQIVTRPVATKKQFSNAEFGIRFEYPDYLSVETDVQKERGSSGELITMISILATSNDPSVAIFVRIIEDPLRDEMFPNLYPPTDETLRILVVGDISDLDFPRSEENETAVLAASEEASITMIYGYSAATYAVSLEGTDFGHMYVRGALVITDRRDVRLYVLGSDEPDAPGSVEPEFIDELWSQFIESLSLDF